jgi:hypothetical protein
VKRAKKGRPRLESPMVHTALALPRDLLEGLKRDAQTADQGLSTEIRERLYFAHSLHRDPQMADLIRLIRNLADGLADDLGKQWHEDPYVLAAFKAGVAEYLAHYDPKGDASTRPHKRGSGEPSDPAEAVGRTLARLFWNTSRKGA